MARELLAGAGDALATAIVAVVRALKLEGEEIPIALAGGFVLGTELVRSRMLDALDVMGYRVQVQLVTEPVVGAVRLAKKMLEQ